MVDKISTLMYELIYSDAFTIFVFVRSRNQPVRKDVLYIERI